MIARATDISSATDPRSDALTAETPLQRQILLWQRELLRRAEQQLSCRHPRNKTQPD